jgi:hypothetical protein
VFSGFRSKDLEELLVTVNCTVTDNITKATYLVVAANLDKQTGKLEKAKKMNLPILSRDDFEMQYLKQVGKSAISSKTNSREKSLPDRLKMLPEVNALMKTFGKYDDMLFEFRKRTENYDTSDAVKQHIFNLDHFSSEIENLLKNVLPSALQHDTDDDSYISFIKATPGDKKRDPQIWKYDKGDSTDSNHEYMMKFFKKNASRWVPGDVLAAENGYRGEGVFFVNKTGKLMGGEEHYNGEVSVPSWVSAMLIKLGKTMKQIIEIYRDGPFHYLIYPKTEQKKINEGLLRVHDYESDEQYVSLDDAEFANDDVPLE